MGSINHATHNGQGEESKQLNIVQQSDLQRDVQAIIKELHENSVQLLAIGNKLRAVAEGYERMLSELRGRSSSDQSKADSASIRDQHSDVQNSEDTKRR